jgi:hypothetical protein
MEPWCRNGIDLQRFESNRTQHRVQIGGTQGIQDVSSAVIMERGTGEPRLQQVEHASIFQPLPYLVEGMIAIQHSQDQGFDPTPRREPMRRVGWDEVVNKGRDRHAS